LRICALATWLLQFAYPAHVPGALGFHEDLQRRREVAV
jgi:hypothetical protein